MLIPRPRYILNRIRTNFSGTFHVKSPSREGNFEQVSLNCTFRVINFRLLFNRSFKIISRRNAATKMNTIYTPRLKKKKRDDAYSQVGNFMQLLIV